MRDKWGRWIYTPYREGEAVRIVFLFQAASVWASWESVYEACMADSNVEVKMLLLTQSCVERAQMISARDFLIGKGIPYEVFEAFDLDRYKPHAAFVQFPYDLSYHAPDALSLRLKEKGIRIAYIPYGIEISDEENARRDHFENFVVENSRWIFTCCEAVKDEYRKYCRNREAVRVCGSPKFDGPAHKGDYPLAQEFEKRANGRKIVLWKMHFPKKIFAEGAVRQITPDLDEYIRFAKESGKYRDLFFIVMPHPKMLYGMVESDIKGDMSLRKKADELLHIIQNADNAVVDTSDDYRNSLYHADVIIMDRSAVMIEAAMLGKPVLLMRNSDYQEKWTNGVRQVADAFAQGSRAEDMEQFLEAVCMGNCPKQEKTEKALEEYFPYQDGLCGRQIKELVKRELAQEAEGEKTGKRLKIVLYGAGEVCRYYLEEGFTKAGWNEEVCEIAAVMDGNPLKWGMEIYGYRIESPEILREIDSDVVVIMTEQNYFEIKKKLVYGFFIDERRIWRLDEFLCKFSGDL